MTKLLLPRSALTLTKYSYRNSNKKKSTNTIKFQVWKKSLGSENCLYMFKGRVLQVEIILFKTAGSLKSKTVAIK